MLDPASDRDRAASDDLDALADHVAQLRDRTGSESWVLFALAADPTVRRDDDLLLADRESVLAQHLPSLARICQTYLTRLNDEVELLPVPRVRRPAKRAVERFAANTEDWAGRTLLGPIPRRALALLRVDDADLYENRMVNELIHPILSSGLARRIRQLRRASTDLADLSDATAEGTYLRRQRLYAFWGGGQSDPGTLSHQAAETLAELERLAAAVRVLRGRPLVRLLGDRRTSQRQLRPTNVIANDRHYHAAGVVWQAYERGDRAVESADERAARLAERHAAFSAYALALIVRALDDLGYRPERDHAPVKGRTLQLNGPATWAAAELTWTEQDTVLLASEGHSTRFIPLIDLVGPADRPEDALARWSAVQAQVTDPSVVVYLAPFRPVSALPGVLAQPLTSAGGDGPNGRTRVSAVPVTPLETTSLERVARAVALAVRAPALEAYPPVVADVAGPIARRVITSLLDGQISAHPLPSLFFRADQDVLHVRRRLNPGETAALDGWVRDRLASARGTGWERDHTGVIERLPKLIADAGERADRVMSCPACGQRADVRALDRDRVDDLLLVSCSCGARWGHHRCARCRGRIPFIAPTRQVPPRASSGPGWVERTYGQDALASPCWRDGESDSNYVCPHCGDCGGADKPLGNECYRCKLRSP
ncbi:hypothetical protein HN031_17830 [Nocardioides sp. zg-1308]|uniref:hypothetical protein n=1 Tax=Nocardioides sp. zg-1308 TaxID=2736253 RepID=UPI0015517623|nr:hypothetical protein [Nocardioides sp. zg-1308]NPD06539.1 hypothetical protein [Nocardioides sp. zg-1308]